MRKSRFLRQVKTRVYKPRLGCALVQLLAFHLLVNYTYYSFMLINQTFIQDHAAMKEMALMLFKGVHSRLLGDCHLVMFIFNHCNSSLSETQLDETRATVFYKLHEVNNSTLIQ